MDVSKEVFGRSVKRQYHPYYMDCLAYLKDEIATLLHPGAVAFTSGADYVFAVCEGGAMNLPAQLVADFMDGIKLAQTKTNHTGKVFSVWPLKTPDWHGLCGHCGEPWMPHTEAARQLAGHGNDETATGSKGGV
jgi:hypothetical protein